MTTPTTDAVTRRNGARRKSAARADPPKVARGGGDRSGPFDALCGRVGPCRGRSPSRGPPAGGSSRGRGPRGGAPRRSPPRAGPRSRRRRRGRDDGRERRPGEHGVRGEASVVAPFAHQGQHRAAEHRRHGDRRSRQRPEDRRQRHGGDREPARGAPPISQSTLSHSAATEPERNRTSLTGTKTATVAKPGAVAVETTEPMESLNPRAPRGRARPRGSAPGTPHGPSSPRGRAPGSEPPRAPGGAAHSCGRPRRRREESPAGPAPRPAAGCVAGAASGSVGKARGPALRPMQGGGAVRARRAARTICSAASASRRATGPVIRHHDAWAAQRLDHRMMAHRAADLEPVEPRPALDRLPQVVAESLRPRGRAAMSFRCVPAQRASRRSITPASRRAAEFAASGHLALDWKFGSVANLLTCALYRVTGPRHGIGRAGFVILLCLRESPGRTVREVARVAGLPKNSISRAVGDLRRRDMIERRRDEDDRRGQPQSATPRGLALLETVLPLFEARQAAATAARPPDERAALDGLSSGRRPPFRTGWTSSTRWIPGRPSARPIGPVSPGRAGAAPSAVRPVTRSVRAHWTQGRYGPGGSGASGSRPRRRALPPSYRSGRRRGPRLRRRPMLGIGPRRQDVPNGRAAVRTARGPIRHGPHDLRCRVVDVASWEGGPRRSMGRATPGASVPGADGRAEGRRRAARREARLAVPCRGAPRACADAGGRARARRPPPRGPGSNRSSPCRARGPPRSRSRACRPPGPSRSPAAGRGRCGRPRARRPRPGGPRPPCARTRPAPCPPAAKRIRSREEPLQRAQGRNRCPGGIVPHRPGSGTRGSRTTPAACEGCRASVDLLVEGRRPPRPRGRPQPTSESCPPRPDPRVLPRGSRRAAGRG